MTAADPRFSVLRAAQAQEWNAVLARVAQHDFYHLAEYHRLAEERGEGTAHLFAYRDGEHTIALPLLLRPVGESGGEAWCDATSVYGYAGPVASHAAMPAGVVRNFQEALKAALIERRVVTVFSRLHPLIFQNEILTGLGDWRPEGETVSIDLTLPPEQQRAQYRAAFKTRINKLRREGLACVRDGEMRKMSEFTAIYHQTMRRVNAHDSYFFEPEYFTRLANCLGPSLQLFVATMDGAVIAGGLFTICDGIVQYHLGMVQYKNGDGVSAKKTLESALRLNKPFPGVCILQVDQNRIECIHHGIRRPAHFAIEAEDRNAVDRIAEIG